MAREDAWRRGAPLLVASVVVAVLTVVLAVNGSATLRDTDTTWHVVSGTDIVDHARFPQVDRYSFTRSGEPWIAKEWLSQVVLAGAWRVAGWGGLVALAAATTASAFGLLAGRLRRHLSTAATLAVLAASFALTAPHVLARPHVLAYPVLVAWTAGLVSRVDGRPGDPPWPMLLLVVLWTNLHAGVAFGLVLGAGLALDAVVRCWRDPARWSVVGRWSGFVAASVLAACVTPYGPRSLLVTVDVLSLGPALDVIGEWMPPTWSSPGPFELLLALAIVAAVVAGRRLRWSRALVLAGVVGLALTAVRNAELLALVAPLLVASSVAAHHPRLAAPADRRPSDARGPATTRRRPGAGVAAAAIVAAGASLAVVALLTGSPAPPSEVVPAAATDAVLDAGGRRLLHEYPWGGYLIGEGVPTFVDGRTELFGGEFVADHAAALAQEDGALLDQLLTRWEIDATMLRPDTPAVRALDESTAWRRLHEDPVAVVHVRRLGAPSGP